MLIVIILGLLSIFFAWLESSGQFKHGLKFSFGLIFLFLAFRYNFGNDYKGYLHTFIDINSYSDVSFYNKSFRVEPGWIFLCRLFKYPGFFAMVATLALFNCYVYYNFIKKYVPVNYYCLALFFYIFTPGFMLIHASAMRQSFAIALFLFSLEYLFKKDAIRYFICVGMASLIHISSLVLIPLYLLSLINWRINKTASIIFVSIFISLYFFVQLLSPYLNQFIKIFFERYEKQQDTGALNSGFGVIYLAALLTLTLYHEKIQNKEISLLFKIYILSFIFFPLGLLLHLIGRVGMYFTTMSIVVFPYILINLEKPIYKILFFSVLLFMTMYGFVQFFNSETWSRGFSSYQTIFSSPQIY